MAIEDMIGHKNIWRALVPPERKKSMNEKELPTVETSLSYENYQAFQNTLEKEKENEKKQSEIISKSKQQEV